MKSISLIVPTHRRQNSVLDFIHSVKSQSLSVDTYELIVVSNLADVFFQGEYFQKAIEGIDCKVSVVGKIGVNRARNLGLKQATGEVVLFIDDDCELVDTELLGRYIELHKKNPEALAIGGSYALPEDAGVVDKAYYVIAKSWQMPKKFGVTSSWRLLGGNLSFKREKLLELDENFDESIVFGASETELLQRLELRGESACFFETLTLLHRTRLTESEFLHKAYLRALMYVRKNIKKISGRGSESHQTYEDYRHLLAWEVAQSQEEFDEIKLLMEAYNFIFYNINADLSERKNIRMAKKWMRQSWGQHK